MDVNAGFKQTEIGIIPEEWEISNLSNCCNYIVDGTHFTPLYVHEGIQFLSVENVTGNNFSNTKFITFEEHRRLIKRCKPEKDDILMTRIGSLGITKYLDWDVEASIYVSLVLLKPKNINLGKFLYCYTKSNQFVKDVEKRSLVNATPQKINMGDIGKVPIPLPPLLEQRAIAEVLSDVDALIVAQETLIAKKRAIKQGVMQELLTGKRRLPGFENGKGIKNTEIGIIPADWKIDIINNLSAITTGSKNTQDRIDDGKYPFFVRSNVIERINTYSFDGEAVLTAGDGVGTGKVFHYVMGKFDLHQRVYQIYNFSELLNGYYFYLFFSQNFYQRIMQMTAKSSVDSVRREMIANMIVPVPIIEEQKAIASIIIDLENEIILLEKKLSKTRLLKQGLMQELLTGRIRLTGV